VKLSGMLADRTKAKATPGRVLSVVKEGMLKEFARGNDRRWDIVHPSELSHQSTFCARSVYLRITEGPLSPEGFDFGLQNIFDEGHSIHAKWQSRLRKYTPLFGNWECRICGVVERAVLEPRSNPSSVFDPGDSCYSTLGHLWEYKEITLDAEAQALLVGHADGGFDETLVEFKSVGEGTARIEDPDAFAAANGDLKELWKGIHRPFKTHLNQGDIYLWICKQNGLPFTEVSFIYESKWNQQIKEFIVPYDEKRSLKLVDQAIAIKYAVDHREEPECRFPGTCKECEPYDTHRSTVPKRIRQIRVSPRLPDN
jgi:hypothetical protein